MERKLKAGDTAYINGKPVTVESVGRRWIVVSGTRERFDVNTLVGDAKSGSRNVLYPQLADYAPFGGMILGARSCVRPASGSDEHLAPSQVHAGASQRRPRSAWRGARGGEVMANWSDFGDQPSRDPGDLPRDRRTKRKAITDEEFRIRKAAFRASSRLCRAIEFAGSHEYTLEQLNTALVALGKKPEEVEK